MHSITEKHLRQNSAWLISIKTEILIEWLKNKTKKPKVGLNVTSP